MSLRSALVAIGLAFCAVKTAALSLDSYISEQGADDSVCIMADGRGADIFIDPNDWPGVRRAAGDLQSDIQRVTGTLPRLVTETKITGDTGGSGRNIIIIGTIGKSDLITRLVGDEKLDLSSISNQWESFVVETITNPFVGVSNALVICGSDKRGAIYGVYDISEQIGVSPWYFWADVPPVHRQSLHVNPGKHVQGPPSVKYRGIFLNDEAPDLTRWIQSKFGSAPGHAQAANYGPCFYTNLFEVILRLKGNYLWPAMWNNAFNEDDTNNPALADMYGIVMGTSHQEPMLRAQKEWDRGLQRKYGNWNYNNTNQQPVLQQFWREGIRRNKNFESIITLGLRAENDSGAPIGKDLTEQIVDVQRKILADEMNPDLTQVPQMWCLYKEVQDFYEEGLRVPDDVTLLWAEDNWGDVRRLPTADERKRSGGAGIYYHFDYHGGPRSYQWLNTSPLPKIWDQMSLAKKYGADRIWIVNVGHFKGYELPMEFFLTLGWNTSQWTPQNLHEFTRRWAAREFGGQFANDIADVLDNYTRYNGRRKPELVDAATYSLVNYGEFEKVVADYNALVARARALSDQLPEAGRAAFYELVLFPASASAQLNEMYLAAAKNALYAAQGRASANDFATQTRSLFAAETNLIDFFNTKFLDGKWDHFMDQSVIGYTSWRDPAQNNLGAIRLRELTVPEAASLGVAVDGSEMAATNGELSLPPFDTFNRQKRFIDVFNRGKTPFDFSAIAGAPWVVLSLTNGTVEKDTRLLVNIDWNMAPKDAAATAVKISGAGSEVIVNLNVFNPAEPPRASGRGFIEGDGFISMEAEHFTTNYYPGPNRWVKIPGFGHTLSGLRSEMPLDAPAAVPGRNAAMMGYKMYFFNSRTVEVTVVTSPVLNFMPDRAIRYAASFDDESPQTVTLVPQKYTAQNGNMDWENSVKNNARYGRSSHVISTPGWHTLKLWQVDPGVVAEKIVVDCGGVRPSYLGPPESFNPQLRR